MRGKLKGLKLCVTILLILEILAAVILICLTTRYHRALVVYLAKSDRQLLSGQLSNAYLLGFEFLVIYSVGLFLWRYIWRSENILEHTNLLLTWNGFSLLIVICGAVTVWFLYSCVESLQNAAAISLFQGMDLYFSDPEWKLLWDSIQYLNQCCGVNGYEDWKETVWMPEEQSRCQSMSESSISILIPYACCKRTAKTCFQNYAPHLTAVTMPFLNSTDINTCGCLPKFNNNTYELFYGLAGIMLIVFILQIFLLIFGCTTIRRVKKLVYSGGDSSDDYDERPLVVVKYPRKVRCVTLTDEDNFDEIEEDEEDNPYRSKCRPPAAEGVSVRQEISDTCDRKKNIFLH